MTNLFERILVPTEMNEFSRIPLRYALLFNKQLGSRLTLLHAKELSWLADQHPLGYYLENEREEKVELESRLTAFARLTTPDAARVSTLLADDSAAHAIVEAARSLRADLIIMGTHGRHGWSRLLMGSVAERVLRESDVPVLTIRPELLTSRNAAQVRTILCPMNFSEVARTALEEASAVAEAFDAELVVLHVAEKEDMPSKLSSVEEEFSIWVDPLIRPQTRYKRIVAHGNAAELVLETADRGADLLVIGGQHQRFSSASVIGTTTERITRFSKQPVITVIRKPVTAQMTAVA
jgi:nucleotide-binding universal stress UspA family protein